MYCDIDCETLICNRCKKPIIECDIFRNCIIEEPKKIIRNKEKTTQNLIVGGPGTELKKLLFRIGIEATSGCKCSDRSKHMDYMEQKEPGWCEKNIDEIVSWMGEEARKRNLPFIKTVAKMLVKLAIRKAKN